MTEYTFRTATPEDAAALLEIYRPYVEETAITFEYDVPSEEEFARRIRTVLRKYPYIIAEAEGKITGYAYVSRFHERKAYDWLVETSVYVARDFRGKGAGSALYARLRGNPEGYEYRQPRSLYRLHRRRGRNADKRQHAFPRSAGLSPDGTFFPVRLQVSAMVRHGLDGKDHRAASDPDASGPFFRRSERPIRTLIPARTRWKKPDGKTKRCPEEN